MNYTTKSAVISSCNKYRYLLSRTWANYPTHCTFVMLNPSTADERLDDPTIRRCVKFADSWGHTGILVVNLFGLRTTNPQGLFDADDPIGPDNDVIICDAVARSSLVVAAWGNFCGQTTCQYFRNRPEQVRKLVRDGNIELRHLGLTQNGHPKHPLARGKHRIPDDTKPVVWDFDVAACHAAPLPGGVPGAVG